MISTSEHLRNLSIDEYFHTLLRIINTNNCNLVYLTDLLSDQPENFSEYKPYLTRRKLSSVNKNIEEIELVYDDQLNVRAILMVIKLNLKKLREIFGREKTGFEPVFDSTAFHFESNYDKISTILSRLKGDYANVDENTTFNYVQFNLKHN